MMKKILIVPILALSLAGCETAQDVAVSISTASQTIKDKVASVQNYATQVCGYLPVAASIVGIFNSGFGTDVAAVTNAICGAVTTRPLADGPGDHRPRVNGVIIRGKFVQ